MTEEDHATAESEPQQQHDLAVIRKRIQAFDKLVDWFIDFDPYELKLYIEEFRARHPDLTDRELANRLIGIKAAKNGLIGAAAGIPGFLAMPITIPTDLVMSWRIQINLALCIAYIYGHDIETKDRDELKTDLYMILAGDAARERLELLGVEIDSVTQKAVRRYLSREVMCEVWKQIGHHIAMTTARRSAVKLTRMIPLIGAPIGFASDYSAAKAVGAFARQYYGDDFKSGRHVYN